MTEIPLDQLDVQHHFSSGVYAKQIQIPAGSVIVSHRHHFDHLSILAVGEALIETSDGTHILANGPFVVMIRAGVHHAVKAKTDCTWFCIHAVFGVDPKYIDESLIMSADLDEMKRLAST